GGRVVVEVKGVYGWSLRGEARYQLRLYVARPRPPKFGLGERVVVDRHDRDPVVSATGREERVDGLGPVVAEEAERHACSEEQRHHGRHRGDDGKSLPYRQPLHGRSVLTDFGPSRRRPRRPALRTL